jgi:hypothetical protein
MLDARLRSRDFARGKAEKVGTQVASRRKPFTTEIWGIWRKVKATSGQGFTRINTDIPFSFLIFDPRESVAALFSVPRW